MKSNEALLGQVGNNKTNGKQVYFWVTSKKLATFLKRGDLDLAGLSKGSLHLEFSSCKKFCSPFSHTALLRIR